MLALTLLLTSCGGSAARPGGGEVLHRLPRADADPVVSPDVAGRTTPDDVSFLDVPKGVAAAPVVPLRSVEQRSLSTSSRTESTYRGIASWYPGSRGFLSVASVATPFGRWTGRIGSWVRICVRGTGRCARLPVVDYCGCPHHRIADLSAAALDRLHLSRSQGLYRITLTRLR